VCVDVGVSSFVFRSVLGVVGLAAVAACAVDDASVDDETAEDALTFRPGVIDTSLPDVDAVGYEVAIQIDDTHKHEAYKAEVKGTYVATRDLTELTLDLDGNTIDSVMVGTRRAEHRREGSKLTIVLPAPVASGKTFTTRVRYHGDVAQADGANPNDFEAFGGLMIKQRNTDGKRIYTSLNWPSKARRWLPLRDHPSDGAMLAMSATFPKAFTVVANGKKVSQADNADGSRTWRYEALTAMPVYDFHLTAYDAWKVDESRSASGVPIASYVYSSQASKAAPIFGELPAAMDFYETTFGKYRWGSATFLEEPIFGGGMEHAGVVSMDETLFRSVPEAREVAFHELAHHWSGNLARIRTWNDFWLSEGFTEYLKARFMAAHDGPAAKKEVLRGYLRDALDADRSSPHALRPADPEVNVLEIFDAISYQKGALVLRQLERVVGEEKMATFLKGWFDRHAFAAVSTAELEKELAEAAGQDLSKMYAGFIHSPGHPEVRVSFTAAGGADYEVKVEQLQSAGPALGFVFPLDLEFVDAAGAKERVVVDVTGKRTTQRVTLARAPRSVTVDPDEYMLGTVACDATATCKDGFSCSSARCVPR
jgi:aminopeptidase N